MPECSKCGVRPSIGSHFPSFSYQEAQLYRFEISARRTDSDIAVPKELGIAGELVSENTQAPSHLLTVTSALRAVPGQTPRLASIFRRHL